MLAEALSSFRAVMIDSSLVVNLVLGIVGGKGVFVVSFQDITSQMYSKTNGKQNKASVSRMWPLICNGGNLSKAQIETSLMSWLAECRKCLTLSLFFTSCTIRKR